MADGRVDVVAKPMKSYSVEEEGLMSKSTHRDNERDNVEVNEDVSTRFVEAMPRASSGAGFDGEDGVVLIESAITSSTVANLPSDLLDLSSVANNSAETKIQKEVKFVFVDAVIEGDNNYNTQPLKLFEVDKVLHQDAVGNSDNAVLRQLLRGPRYFDPPDSNCRTCYKCGDEGHSAAKCNSARRKKPCFVCGSLMHVAKQCQKSRHCFICKLSGHVAKDCPEKFNGLFQGCLKCGSHGHLMFSCTNDYSSDDLKEIQCYVCKEVGHLCCTNYFWNVSTVVTCYRCGQLGHTGLACSEWHGEKAADGTPISCFKCGEEGHFSRACKSAAKAKKRKRKWTSRKKKVLEEGDVYNDPSKVRMNGNLDSDGNSSSKRKKKPRWSSKRQDERTPNSMKSRHSFEHGYTASRFGNPSAGGLSKENQWW